MVRLCWGVHQRKRRAVTVRLWRGGAEQRRNNSVSGVRVEPPPCSSTAGDRHQTPSRNLGSRIGCSVSRFGDGFACFIGSDGFRLTAKRQSGVPPMRIPERRGDESFGFPHCLHLRRLQPSLACRCRASRQCVFRCPEWRAPFHPGRANRSQTALIEHRVSRTLIQTQITRPRFSNRRTRWRQGGSSIFPEPEWRSSACADQNSHAMSGLIRSWFPGA